MSIGHFSVRDPEQWIFICAVLFVGRMNKLNIEAMAAPQSPMRFYLGVQVPTLDDAVEFNIDLQNLVDRDEELWTAASKIGPPRGVAHTLDGEEVVAFYWPSVELYPSQPWGKA
jgi:hypothetical protein